jgi:uncharacterized membrane protein
MGDLKSGCNSQLFLSGNSSGSYFPKPPSRLNAALATLIDSFRNLIIQKFKRLKIMSESNSNSRLEAFCDGVFAIALTLLIIDIKIPSTAEINSTNEFWLVLRHIIPSILAFVLSFLVILITWVNHHACIKTVNKSSVSFVYSNGFLLLTVVFVPFPTSLLGEHILSNHAGPAVFLYNLVWQFKVWLGYYCVDQH